MPTLSLFVAGLSRSQLKVSSPRRSSIGSKLSIQVFFIDSFSPCSDLLSHILSRHKDTFDDKVDRVLDIGAYPYKGITEEDHSIYFMCPICSHRYTDRVLYGKENKNNKPESI